MEDHHPIRQLAINTLLLFISLVFIMMFFDQKNINRANSQTINSNLNRLNELAIENFNCKLKLDDKSSEIVDNRENVKEVTNVMLSCQTEKERLVKEIDKLIKEKQTCLSELNRPKFIKISKTIREVTAYNVGDVAQNDSDPCKSANGEDICVAMSKGYQRCAANFVPFGTYLYVEKMGLCQVTDRMNSRYPNTVDWAMNLNEKERAKNFSRQKLEVTVLKLIKEF